MISMKSITVLADSQDLKVGGRELGEDGAVRRHFREECHLE